MSDIISITPGTLLATLGDRAFSSETPNPRNSLPKEIRDLKSLSTFKSLEASETHFRPFRLKISLLFKC